MKKKLVILGAGESGSGTAVLGQMKGWDVFVSDLGTIKGRALERLEAHDIPFESGSHDFDRIQSADLVVKSPGLSDKTPVMQAVLSRGIAVWSEIEFAAQYTDAKLIGISGTNGKTTTTLLTHHLLSKVGLNVGLAGNIGHSFAYQVATENFDRYVLELSSFQLDNLYRTRLQTAVLTNITPDHLDRYQYDVDLYAGAKMRLGIAQTSGDAFVYNADDEMIARMLEKHPIKARLIPFSLQKEVEEGAFVRGNEIIFRIHNSEFIMPINELPIKGLHNQANTMAAGIVARLEDIRKEAIRESLKSFENVEHRLEFVASIGGVEYINDSKATNVNSAWFALESADKPVIWIAGGIDKGNDYSQLLPLVKEKVKAIVCLGLDNRPIHEAFSRDIEVMVNTTSMPEAVQMAAKLALKGDMVMLSPACASFDLFENYEDRGRQFKKAVKEL